VSPIVKAIVIDNAFLNLKLSKVAPTFACLCSLRLFVRPPNCVTSFEAAQNADDFANFCDDQPKELKNFALKRWEKRRKYHEA